MTGTTGVSTPDSASGGIDRSLEDRDRRRRQFECGARYLYICRDRWQKQHAAFLVRVRYATARHRPALPVLSQRLVPPVRRGRAWMSSGYAQTAPTKLLAPQPGPARVTHPRRQPSCWHGHSRHLASRPMLSRERSSAATSSWCSTRVWTRHCFVLDSEWTSSDSFHSSQFRGSSP